MRRGWVAACLGLAACVVSEPAGMTDSADDSGTSTTIAGDGDGDGDTDTDTDTDTDADTGTDTDTDPGPDCEPDPQPPGHECVHADWHATFGSDESEDARAVAVSPEGDVYVAGYTHGSLFTDEDVFQTGFVARLSPEGEVVWGHQLGDGLFNGTWDLVLAPEVGIYVVGTTDGELNGKPSPSGTDLYVARYEFDGTLVWLEQLATEGNEFSGSAVAVAPNGDVLAGGGARGTDTEDYDAVIARFSPEGERLWFRYMHFWALDFVREIVVEPAGDIWLTGLAGPHNDNWDGDYRDGFIAKLESDGSTIFAEQFGHEDATEEGVALLLEPDGGARVIAQVYWREDEFCGVGNTDVAQFFFSDDGTLLKTRVDGSPNREVVGRAIRHPDGTVYVAGKTHGSLVHPQAPNMSAGFILGYDAEGTRTHADHYASVHKNSFMDVALGPDGELVAAGSISYPDGESTDGEVLVIRRSCD